MSNYRRLYRTGKTYFFTLVTHNRQKIFNNETARLMFRQAIESEQKQRPFDMPAIVLMPEHLHCVWQLPESDSDFSVRWACIKKDFTKCWLAQGGRECPISEYRTKYRERGVWQRRFWEHMIRDEDDYMRHVNYIHYNPVKHGLVSCPHHWQYSSFHRWMADGYYAEDWLCSCGSRTAIEPDFSELQHDAGE